MRERCTEETFQLRKNKLKNMKMKYITNVKLYFLPKGEKPRDMRQVKLIPMIIVKIFKIARILGEQR